MRTNIVLDDELVAEGMRLTGAKTKRELVHRALTELVERRRPMDWKDLVGQVQFADGYDPKQLSPPKHMAKEDDREDPRAAAGAR
ncbi:MAG TPA: type II toxin-antitoxin system VapB family antitoxin [Thermoanaerobaculia bacterium]|nr:type II toxin-antitoxin system VapB family antitoxin [Thermoanaerobaculia bacterium]